MKAYVVITFLIPESASKLPSLLISEGWAVRRCGSHLVEANEEFIGGISVFEVEAKDITETGPIRDRVRILLNEAEIGYFSLFIGPAGGAGWVCGNVPLSKALPEKEGDRPTAWQRLENPEL